MAQFDVFLNPNPETQQNIPYLLDIQADLLQSLATRVVVPLYHKGNITCLLQHLNPTVFVEQTEVVASVAELAALSLHYLGEPICNLSQERASMIAAMDVLLTGV